MPFRAQSEPQMGVLPYRSPANSDSNASFTRSGFAGRMNISRIDGFVTRNMNHEYSRGPLRMFASKCLRARAYSWGRSSAVATSSAPSNALCIARYTPDENIGSMKVKASPSIR